MSVASYRLGGDDADRRLDRLLRKLFPDVPLSGLYRAIRTGAVTVNSRRVAPAQRTRQGDMLVVDLAAADGARRPAARRADPVAPRPLAVVAETGDTLVINKPPGLPMSGRGDSVLARLGHHVPDAPSLTFHPSPVHQLDRITSGALLVAKTLHGAREWSQRFATRAVDKRYLAVVIGRCEAGHWRDHMRFDRRRAIAARTGHPRSGAAGAAAAVGIGREASLRCAPLMYAATDGQHFTLLLVHLETGRRHQIRAQAAWRGHPIDGDGRYGSRSPSGRHPFLHAWQLSCVDARLTAIAPPAAAQLRELERVFPDARSILRDALDYRW